MKTISLILDLDNTLYSWMDAFAPALNETCKYLSKTTKQPIKNIRASFKKVFLEHQSVEVVNSVKELDIWNTEVFTLEEKLYIQNISQTLFFDEFRAKLQLYPNVLTVLQWAKNRGYLLIAFSDARAYWINFRLKALGIETYFDKIYVREDEEEKSVSCEYPLNFTQYLDNQCKPSLSIINEIINSYNLAADNVYAIGDSKRKDILPAIKAGINNIWAKYGTYCLPANRRLMSSITPWSSSQRSGGGNIKPQYTIEDFHEIVHILNKI